MRHGLYHLPLEDSFLNRMPGSDLGDKGDMRSGSDEESPVIRINPHTRIVHLPACNSKIFENPLHFRQLTRVFLCELDIEPSFGGLRQSTLCIEVAPHIRDLL